MTMSTTTTLPGTVVQRPQSLSLLATLAIVGQLVLLASALLLPIWSQYSLIHDNISELALGRHGFIQTAAFVIAGVGTLALALAIRQLTKGSWGSRVASLLVAVYGAGAILSAVFPTDRIDSPTDMSSLSASGAIHIAVAIASFLSIIVGMFILTRTFSKEPGWGLFWRLSVFFPAGSLALIIVQQEGPLIGILQRALVIVISAWLILVALRVRSIVTPGR
jgi:hypothetical protein